MANGIEELVNMLYDKVSDAKTLPFGADKCIVDRESMLDLIDEIKVNLPKDLEQARTIVENRNDIIAQAKGQDD